MKILALSICIFLVGCMEYNGKLVSNESISFKRGLFKDTLPTGDYNARLKVFNRKKVKIKAGDKSITIKTKGSHKFPIFDINQLHKEIKTTCLSQEKTCVSNSTTIIKKFNFKKDEINQPFNLNGVFQAKSLGKEEVSEIESCMIYPNIQECQRYARDRGYDPGRSYSMCNNGIPGLRNVTYTGFKYNTDIKVVINQSNLQKGNLHINKNQLVKEYSYFGDCIRKRQ